MKQLILVILLSTVFAVKGIADTAKKGTDAEAGAVVAAWCKAHNDWNLKALESLYAPKVFYYGKELSRKECLSLISNKLRPTEVFEQTIVSDIKITPFPGGFLKCDFSNEMFAKGKTSTLLSYLVLRREAGGLVIVVESDQVTDQNVNRKLVITDKVSLEELIPTKKEEAQKSAIPLPFLLGGLGLVAVIVVTLLLLRKRKKTPVPEKAVSSGAARPAPAADPAEVKGHEFKNFVISRFDQNYFRLLDWRSDKDSGFFTKAISDPEMLYEFHHMGSSDKFAVECKYRSAPENGSVGIARARQISHYRQFSEQHAMKVYIVLGLGGSPKSPSELFILPLEEITGEEMPYAQLKNFARSANNRFFYNPQDPGRKLS